MLRYLAAANSDGRSKGPALLLSTSNICFSSHFAIEQSKQFLLTQISLGATYLKLGKVADEVPPILSNFLCGTMCDANKNQYILKLKYICFILSVYLLV